MEPICLPCEKCDNGRTPNGDCNVCDGAGHTELRTCPKMSVSGDVWGMMLQVELFEKGMPPLAGGSLDQTEAFLDVMEFVWSQRASLRPSKET
jgi:hypothetical protein